MRIPLPGRFTATQTLVFATLVLIVQFAEGTNPVFAALFFVYVLLFALAFNTAGGIFFPSGAYVFFFGTLTGLVGVTYKCFLVEPGQTNLRTPVKSMAVYTVGMAGMALAAYFSQLLRPKKALISPIEGEQMKAAAIGCAIFGIVTTLFSGNANLEGGSVASAFQQINRFAQMAIILGTIYEIKSSGGKRSTNLSVWSCGLFLFGYGLLNFSKEGMFLPITTWLVPAAAMGFNFSRKVIMGMALGAFVLFYYLVPYSQYGRQARVATGADRQQAVAAYGYLSNLGETRKLFKEEEQREEDTYLVFPHLYDHPQGLWDRLTMLAYDDGLIDVTDRGQIFGILPTIQDFENVIPRFLWKNKPAALGGNDYGHELGVVGDADTTTGISFSPVGDAYHQAGWIGVIVLAPLIWFGLFFMSDSLCGDVRLSPFGLLYIALFTHTAPEGLLGGSIYLLTYGSEAIILISLLCRYVMPLISTLLLGRQKNKVRRGRDFTMPPPPTRVRAL